MQRQYVSHMIASFMLAIGLSACQTAMSTTPENISGQAPNLKLAAQYNVELGVSYLQQGDVARARQKFVLATKQDPNAARKAYQKALAIAPNSSETLNNYGVFLCQQGQAAQAVNYFQQAVSDPSYANIGQAYENAGFCALKIPDKARAEQFFTKALANEPQLPNTCLALMQMALDRQEIDRAQDYLNRYNQVAKPSADSLWLTVLLARQQNNQILARDAGSALAHDFPESRQYQQYLKQGTTS